MKDTKQKITEALQKCNEHSQLMIQSLQDAQQKTNDSINIIFDFSPQIESLCRKYEQTIKQALQVSAVNFIFIKTENANDKQQKKQQKAADNSASRTRLTTKRSIADVKKTIAVISGKGGVGKSTIAAYLALALTKHKKNVGIFDADIYGPSLARMLGVTQDPMMKDNQLLPPIVHKLKFMSLSLMMDEDTSLMWRGPMVSKMIYRLLHETNWSHNSFFTHKESDYLIIDTPPGTGDILITLLKDHQIDGAIVVSTPQKVALDATNRSITMLQKLNVPIVGILENMSDIAETNDHFITKVQTPFKGGSIASYALEKNLHYLGAIPMMPDISANSDGNISLQTLKQNKIIAQIFDHIAQTVQQFSS